MVVRACPSCGVRVVPRQDGSCPSCQEVAGELEWEDAARRPPPVPDVSPFGDAHPSRSLRGLCQILTGILAAIAATCAVAAVYDLSLLEHAVVVGPRPGIEREAELRDALTALSYLCAGLQITCVVLFLWWFYRAHLNLRTAGVPGLRYASGWAIGGFFVPLLNLVLPYLVMRQVWRGSLRVADETHRYSLVAWWWGLFLIAFSLESTAVVLASGATYLIEMGRASQVMFVADLVTIASAAAAVLLVRRITRLQERGSVA